eukprot:GHVP01048422.1.p1 GENE.GHVP01048422.1~~GHVP01048422.1.p1  ORF type:complete len:329 (-),score=47.72 GHVP01048422.1:56-1042(-)
MKSNAEKKSEIFWYACGTLTATAFSKYPFFIEDKAVFAIHETRDSLDSALVVRSTADLDRSQLSAEERVYVTKPDDEKIKQVAEPYDAKLIQITHPAKDEFDGDVECQMFLPERCRMRQILLAYDSNCLTFHRLRDENGPLILVDNGQSPVSHVFQWCAFGSVQDKPGVEWRYFVVKKRGKKAEAYIYHWEAEIAEICESAYIEHSFFNGFKTFLLLFEKNRASTNFEIYTGLEGITKLNSGFTPNLLEVESANPTKKDSRKSKKNKSSSKTKQTPPDRTILYIAATLTAVLVVSVTAYFVLTHNRAEHPRHYNNTPIKRKAGKKPMK